MGVSVNPWSNFRSAVILLNRMDFALCWLAPPWSSHGFHIPVMFRTASSFFSVNKVFDCPRVVGLMGLCEAHAKGPGRLHRFA